jgi:hypothetical protein
MPQQQQGDMWSVYQEADLFLITTNATLKRNGALVIGRGIARQARDRFPGLDIALGRHIYGVCGSRSERFTQMFPFGTFFLLHRIANATSPQASLPAELAVVVSRFVFETTKWVRSYPQ